MVEIALQESFALDGFVGLDPNLKPRAAETFKSNESWYQAQEIAADRCMWVA